MEGEHELHDTPEQGPAPDAGPDGDGRSPAPRWVRWALAGTALVALVVTAAFVALPASPPPTTTTTTSTSTTTSSTTTTTTVPTLAPGAWEVATVKPSVTRVQVRGTPPPGWDAAPPLVQRPTRELPPASEATVAPRDPLPRADLPIVGRFATPVGWAFDNPGPYDPPQPFTMLVEERRGDWVQVHVPVRPNGTRGWVRAADVDVTTVTHRIEIHLGERMLRAWDGERLLAATPVVVGTPATPTPTGLFYVTDVVPQANPSGSYGPVALATDGYSEVMDRFSTGVPVIALHGTNRPDLLGRDVSNGCVRLPNDVIEALAAEVPLGTPVLIWP